MNKVQKLTLLSLVQVALLVGCETASSPPSAPAGAVASDQLYSSGGPQFSEWSEPVHLDAPINSPYHELGATFSSDELSIYFGSDRPGGQGAFDIWVAHRACRDCPWGEAVNLGPIINSAGGDGGPALSPGGHYLFFSSARTGGAGGEDIWVSHRTSPEDDLAWEPPINLGPNVNTAAQEQGPHLFSRGEGGGGDLVFFREGLGFYQTRVTLDGTVLGPAVPVAEINDLTAADPGEAPAGTRDEIYFQANRGGGGSDIWVSTRRNFRDPWSAPHRLGAPVNTPGADLTPSVSANGRTLLFAAGQAARPSLGFQDLWVSTRMPIGLYPD